jgi:hypothetical protein
MLTNFIREAANEVSVSVLTTGAENAVVGEASEPVVLRRVGNERREAHATDIYDRARLIYLRARRPARARSANIL